MVSVYNGSDPQQKFSEEFTYRFSKSFLTEFLERANDEAAEFGKVKLKAEFYQSRQIHTTSLTKL